VIPTDQIQISIMQKVEKDVRKELASKKSYRKKLEVALEKISRRTVYRIFNNPKVNIKKYQQNSSFGYDEFGRDVEDGLRQYIRLLKSRKLQIDTVIVLGSRAKGSWTPTSDVDVTIIAGNLPKEGKNLLTRRLFGLRRNLILSDRPIYLGIEPSGCCSKTEFLEQLEQFDLQALDAVLYGWVIHDNGFWQTVKEKYNEMEKKYKLNEIPLKESLRTI
jgi:predicted nucleotidyltransferase